MKRLLGLVFTVLVFMLWLPDALSFHKKPKFYKGIVVLHSGDTLACEMKFTRKVSEGLLQIWKTDHIEVLTVKDVRSFSFEDDKKQQLRTFYNLPLIPDLATRRHEVFVERVYGNENMVIVNHRTMGFSEKSWQFNPFRKKNIVDKFYLLDTRAGLVLPLSKENILAMMKEKKEIIDSYLHSNSLKLKNISDYIALIDYHQSIR